MFGYSGLKAVRYFIDGNTLTVDKWLSSLVASVTAFCCQLVRDSLLMNYIKKQISQFSENTLSGSGIVLLYEQSNLFSDNYFK